MITAAENCQRSRRLSRRRRRRQQLATDTAKLNGDGGSESTATLPPSAASSPTPSKYDELYTPTFQIFTHYTKHDCNIFFFEQTDKASLLAEVVRRVKELKKTAAELEPKETDQSDDTIGSMIPSENDELELTYVGEDSSTKKMMMKAMICCEDRAELIMELTRALGLVRGKVMRMEIGTLGGRIRCVLWIQVSGITREQGLHELRRALKVVMDRGAFLDLPRNKRPRISGCI